jgi:hypothetical protein
MKIGTHIPYGFNFRRIMNNNIQYFHIQIIILIDTTA